MARKPRRRDEFKKGIEHAEVLECPRTTRIAMISARQAMDSIVKYIRDFSEYIPSTELRLEEIEACENDEWRITVSYSENPFTASPRRTFKLFRVDGNSAEVIAMKSVNDSF